ncbi:MAG: hypothetical protein EHM12_05825 [Dehalococcoidia bacterium]|nr:MAG: hypothetical protein EHM12_05825 [Dehalococcoidia bacterium]
MRTRLNALIIAAITVLSAAALFTNISCTAPQQPKENQPPKIEQVGGSTSWSPLSEGQFTVTATDPDGDNLTYSWLADNGTLTANGNSAIWKSPAEMGQYNITMIVNDGHGHEVRGVKEVKVIVNADGSQTPDPAIVLKMSLPSAETATGAKRVRIWTSSPVECVVDGANQQGLKYSWTASNGRTQGKGLDEGTASKVTWIAPGVAGDYTLDVVVSDSQGNQCKGTVNFEVFCCGN